MTVSNHDAVFIVAQVSSSRDGTQRGALKVPAQTSAGGTFFTIGVGPQTIPTYAGGMLPPSVIRELIKREALLRSEP